MDVLFVDTAGRLQTKVNLMEELTKIRQVLGKKHPGAPHRSILVLDATTGQNALSQTKLFLRNLLFLNHSEKFLLLSFLLLL